MKKYVKLGITAALMTALCACGGPKNNNTVTNDVNNTAAVENQEATANSQTDQENGQVSQMVLDENGYKVTVDKAVEAFQKQYPNAQLTEISCEEENGNVVYELGGKDQDNDYKMQIHATSGEILGQEQEAEKNQVIEALDLSQVKTEKEAMAAAKKETKEEGLMVESWSLEVENKQAVYEVGLLKDNKEDLDVKLDAKTLQLIELDR